MIQKIVKYPEFVKIDETDFNNAYARLVNNCLMFGMEQKYGNVHRIDITGATVLTGNAIKQIENREVHPMFPTKGKHLDEYCNEFTEEYFQKEKTDMQEFEYTYYQRLRNYLHVMYNNIRTKPVFNNQIEMITWIPDIDSIADSPPCLQRIWIRTLSGDTCEVHITWRSRDLYGAWMSNIVGVIYMVNKYVLKGDFKIVRIVDFCDSLHIYSTDIENAKRIKQIIKSFR